MAVVVDAADRATTELQKRLMHQHGRRHRRSVTLPGEVAAGDRVQLVVQGFEQLAGGIRPAFVEGADQRLELSRRGHVHG